MGEDIHIISTFSGEGCIIYSHENPIGLFPPKFWVKLVNNGLIYFEPFNIIGVDVI